MKRQLLKINFTLFFIFSYLIGFQSFSQYSKGLYKSNLSAGYLGLLTLDTDPVLKFAKDAAPFDKPFFIKIKRPSKGKPSPALGTKTDITKYTALLPLVGPAPVLPVGFATASSVELKTEAPIPNPAPPVPPSTITLVTIEDEMGPPVVINHTIYSSINQAGKVYEEAADSESIYIAIENLNPEQAYKLSITWANPNQIEIYKFTTVATNLEKRLKQKIIPQIGITAIFFKGTDQQNIVVRRYAKLNLVFGFHYYPRPIDPDISIRAYKPFAMQRFSFLGGLTLNSLAVDNMRANLFGSNNIIVGIGYQAFDALRISYGGLLFYELNPNKLYAEHKTLKATSSITFTLDLKLKDILGGIVTTLGFK